MHRSPHLDKLATEGVQLTSHCEAHCQERLQRRRRVTDPRAPN
eukprot:SAG22_NODE_72_length_22344_cov_95.586559_3_plen_43_part_00